MNGNIFDIQRYSIHDGCGIRTVVFLKGCPLHCKWCSNPESQQPEPSLFYSESTCIHCFTCVRSCPNHEITEAPDGRLRIDWAQCRNTDLAWTDCCPTNALRIKGCRLSIEETLREIRKDIPFYGCDGGVTFSGGEPLLQAQFIRSVSEQCAAEQISTAVETAGMVPWDSLDLVRPVTGLFLYDVKTMDCALHQKWIGTDNRLILSNLRRLSSTGANIMVRTPLIPGVNDTVESVQEILNYLRECGIHKYSVLPFHQYGSGKYKACGMPYELESLQPLPEEKVREFQDMIQSEGFSMSFEDIS